MTNRAQQAATITETLHHYFHAWNSATADERAAELAQSFEDTGVYIDPHAGELQGLAAVQQLIEQFRSKYDYPLEAMGHLDLHHRLFRLPWRLGDKRTGVLSHGLFTGEIGASGKIVRLWVFIDSDSNL
ncbi:MAG: hypothetical protein F6J97_13620 [Leptolyngbya sp. SIO4C1]|nr:hypothetical protein [Leptolyngbya sp. SIO4C1]